MLWAQRFLQLATFLESAWNSTACTITSPACRLREVTSLRSQLVDASCAEGEEGRDNSTHLRSTWQKDALSSRSLSLKLGDDLALILRIAESFWKSLALLYDLRRRTRRQDDAEDVVEAENLSEATCNLFLHSHNPPGRHAQTLAAKTKAQDPANSWVLICC